MAQNDTHVALIILTTQMWGGEIIGGKNFFGPNFVFLCLWRQHPFLISGNGLQPARMMRKKRRVSTKKILAVIKPKITLKVA